MTGMVLVSHSRVLAEAVAGLVRQVSQGNIPIAVAAGIGPNREEFGTDTLEIVSAIESLQAADGVLVLMDLGSAVLSAQMALDFLPVEMLAKVRLCPAPFVEGAIAAGVQASVGADLDDLCREALGALLPKVEQVGEQARPPEGAGRAEAGDTGRGVVETAFTLQNKHGLHARPAARFVQTAASFDADVRVRNLRTGKGPVPARSLNSLVTLGAVKGDTLVVQAAGPQATEALQAIQHLAEEVFGVDGPAEPATGEPAAEDISPLTAEATLIDGVIQALPVSEGVALGPLYHYRLPLPVIPETPAQEPRGEWEKLEEAIAAVHQAILARRQQVERSAGQQEAAIFDAHLLILQDPDLLDAAHRAIHNEGATAATAWHAAVSRTAETYEALVDSYLQQRAADVWDVGRQVLFALGGWLAETVRLPEPGILFAQELTPTETVQLDMSHVLGIISSTGGPNTHSAILARGLGIPSVSGAGTSLRQVEDGVIVGLDGLRGMVWVDPPAEIIADLRRRREAWLAERQRLIQAATRPAAMRNGRRIHVAANVGRIQDALAATANGAEGIGLLRTEFLYLTRRTAPIEEEQVAALRQIGQRMGDQPVIVRTLDAGGDKDLPYLHLPPEANPFLGVRAIRLMLRHPNIFLTQLRAILQAGVDRQFRIMFPMVTNLEEFRQARSMLEQAHQQLEEGNTPHLWPVETGIMVEVPSAALLSRTLAPEVDFFSIGTNDLTQYTLAAERGNAELAHLADALHPAVLRLVQEVVQAAHPLGKWVGVCGEAAGDPDAVPILTGIGVDELSMSPASIPRVKALLGRLDLQGTASLAIRCLEMADAGEVRAAAREYVDRLTAG